MIPRVRVLASSIDDMQISFECGACGWSGTGQVIAVGRAEMETLAMLEDAIAEDVMSAAERQLPAEASFALDLAGCPSCRKRSRQAVVKALLKAIPSGIASKPGCGGGMLAFVVGMALLMAGLKAVVPIAFTVITIIGIGVAVRAAYHAQVREAEARVTWPVV